MFYIEGSGHGGQVMVSNSYLDGSYTERYPEITQDEKEWLNYLSNLVFQVVLLLMLQTSIHEGWQWALHSLTV